MTRASMPAKDTQLRGHLLPIVRIAWLIVALLAVGLFVAGMFSYWRELHAACDLGARVCRNLDLPAARNFRQQHALGLPAGFYAAYSVILTALCGAVWAGMGAVIFWRRSDDWMALLVALFLVVFGTATLLNGPSGVLGATHPMLWLPVKSVQFLGEICLTMFFYTFPSGRFVPGWTRWVALAYLAMRVPQYFFPSSPLNPENWSNAASVALFLGLLTSLFVAQVYRYRYVSTPEQRYQTKWIVFGSIAALAGFLAFVLPYFATEPGGTLRISYATLLQNTGMYLSMLLIPISIGIAMLRSRLFDIDFIINRTLVYGLLTASLAGTYLGLVIALQYAFRRLTGGESQLAVVATTLTIAALFHPLRKRFQELIDRRFYRRKYDAQKMLETFSARLRDETDLNELAGALVSIVQQTMQPEYASLWLQEPQRKASRE